MKDDCGPPCRELNDREHAMHLLSLGGKSDKECYRLTAKGNPSAATCETEGPKILRKPQLRAAMEHHRRVEAARYRATRDRSVERLAAGAEGANMVRFMDAQGQVDIGLLRADPELGRALRGIEYHEDGSVKKVLFHPGVQFENALAKLGGWEAPIKVDISTDDLVAAVEAGGPAKDAALRVFQAIHALGKDPSPEAVAEIKARWRRGEFDDC